MKDLKLIGYSDSNFNREKETRVSIYGYTLSLESTIVSWRLHKQSILANSTTKEEYLVDTKETKEIV